jgi:hypothetical protein
MGFQDVRNEASQSEPTAIERVLTCRFHPQRRPYRAENLFNISVCLLAGLFRLWFPPQ